MAAFETAEAFPRRPLALREAAPAALPGLEAYRRAWTAAAFAA
jgi:hypothetical protein